jgi:pyruvate,orthophosphate dikinase
VGAASVEVGDGVVTIGDRTFRAGDTISIDGDSGQVFAGAIAGESVVVPEVPVLLAWANELGIPIGEAPTPAESAAAAAVSDQPSAGVGADDLLRMLLVKGYASPESAAAALLSTPDDVTAILDRLVADGLAEMAAGSFRLTVDGRAIGRERIAGDAERWGEANARAALDAFLALDHRMKETVTAWQMREVDGTQTFNDHADPAYDANVLADLDALHADARAWARSLEAGLPQLAVYRERLERAADSVRGGDYRYVASPRVDSYHGIWFELHEELILLAGRSRADEVAAGRA